MLSVLNRDDRLRLMKFVCSFAWADLEIRPEERDFVAGLVRRLDLSASERRQVEGWLQLPPKPEAVDPTTIPLAHRKIFLQSVEGVIAADGEIAEEERESLSLFKALLT